MSGKAGKHETPQNQNKISAYSEVVNSIINNNFESKKLKELYENLQSAAKGIDKLGAVAVRINQKLNGIANFILNFLMWWDFRCAFLLQKWKQQYSSAVKNWFNALGEFESLLSFSHLPNVCKNTCLPTFSNDKARLNAQEIGHPLIANEKRVYNDIDFNNDISIISGSNMSGKTTFLRTIGINIVLAKAGSFVCGASCCCSLFDVYTSMRISDNLNEGVSTFYAELIRIKSLLDHAKQKSQILFLIDEIFKGTNSIDRLEGAKAVILKLEKMGASGLISTHDLELCNLEDSNNRLSNLSFCEHYKEDKIMFDYKLKNEKSTSTNAAYLLKMVGIINN